MVGEIAISKTLGLFRYFSSTFLRRTLLFIDIQLTYIHFKLVLFPLFYFLPSVLSIVYILVISLICLFNKWFWKAPYSPGTVLGTHDIKIGKSRSQSLRRSLCENRGGSDESMVDEGEHHRLGREGLLRPKRGKSCTLGEMGI